MSNLAEFYANGGLFNHFVTISLGVAVAALVFARQIERRARWLDTCGRALVACVGFGALGTAFGITEVGAAVATVPPEQAAAAASRGMGIAIIPVAWSLMVALPVWLVCMIARHRAA